MDLAAVRSAGRGGRVSAVAHLQYPAQQQLHTAWYDLVCSLATARGYRAKQSSTRKQTIPPVHPSAHRW